MEPAGTATILHADLDAFYASVEQLLEPNLRGRPIAVGGGVVLAASYEARAFGVRGGMPGRTARSLCPGITFVGGHFSDYQRLGDQVMGVLGDFTPWVERVSIDEAFLDVTGATRLLGPPAEIARTIRARVAGEIGLRLSIGVARTKHLAKVASQVAKPDGLIVVDPGAERAFLDPLPVELMWGVGPATSARLAAVGIRTIGDLAATGSPLLEHLLGRASGSALSSLAANDDPRRVTSGGRAKSVGAQAALGHSDPSPELVGETMTYLADRVAGRLRTANRAGRRVTVRVRFEDLRSVTRSATVRSAVWTTSTLTDLACELARTALADHPEERHVTLLAVSVSRLVAGGSFQLELPLGHSDGSGQRGSHGGAARWGLDRSMDAIRARFGQQAVGYAVAALSEQGRVPEAFRELAEHDRRPGPSAGDPGA